MDHALTTQRTTLRTFRADDVPELLDIFRDSAVRRFLLDDQPVSKDWVRAEISASERRFQNLSAGLWAVRLAGDPTVVGFAGFRPFFEPPELQLLYGLLPGYWGNGLATEAAARVCEYVFEDLDFREVTAAIDIPNDASARVLNRLGMKRVRVTSEGTAGTAFYRLARGAWEPSSSTRQPKGTAQRLASTQVRTE